MSQGLYNSSLHDAIVKECGNYKSPSDKCQGLIDQMHTDLGHINVYDIYTPCIMDMEKNQGQIQLQSDYRAPFSSDRAERFGAAGPDGCIDAGAAKKYLDIPAVWCTQRLATASTLDVHLCNVFFFFFWFRFDSFGCPHG